MSSREWRDRLGFIALPLVIVGLFGSILGFVPDLAWHVLGTPALVWFIWGRIERFIP